MSFNIKDLPEVVSKEHFISLLDDLLKNRNNFSKDTFIKYLELLGEKYEKFYDTNIISEITLAELYRTLKEYTELDKLNLMKNLVGIMFQFRVDKYADFLSRHLNLIKLEDVYNEIYDALKEYGTN